MIKNFMTKEGEWITLRPLNIFQREELTYRFNNLHKYSSISSLVLDEKSEDYYNIACILKMYSLDIEELYTDDIEAIIKDCIIPLNFPQHLLVKPKDAPASKEVQEEVAELDNIAGIFTSIWGLCESAAEAYMIMNELPAEVLLKAADIRAKDLERMYSDPKERQKKESKKLANELKEKAIGMMKNESKKG